MGGSALKVPTRRLPAATYHALVDTLGERLRTALGGAIVRPIPAYRTKPDFGDLDLIVESEAVIALDQHIEIERGEPQPRGTFLREWVAAHAHARDVYFEKNSPVFSFDYRERPDEEEGFQVDLILTPRQEIDVAQAYFSYNDLGNLVGRPAHKMGFSHGHRGLLYPIRQNTTFIGEAVVSQDVDAILSFLGYEPAPFHAGFETLEDMFTYAASTPYFHQDIFLLHNRNHASRTRDRKRISYQKFLAWTEVTPGLPAYPWSDHEDESARAAEKAFHLARAHEAFPHLAEAIAQTWDRHRAAIERKGGEERRAIIQGMAHIVGLEGHPFSQFLSSFRTHVIPDQEPAAWWQTLPEAEAREALLAHRARWTPAAARPRRTPGPR